jgi:hypothetical protein
MLDPVRLVPMLLIAVVAALIVRQTLVLLRARRRERRRVVEKPNSHYTPQSVVDRDTRHRWEAIDAARIHEINREEVERLLNKADALGVAALRPNERTFLDRMLELSAPRPLAN